MCVPGSEGGTKVDKNIKIMLKVRRMDFIQSHGQLLCSTVVHDRFRIPLFTARYRICDAAISTTTHFLSYGDFDLPFTLTI